MEALKGVGVLAVVAGIAMSVAVLFSVLEPVSKPNYSNLSAAEAISANFK